MSTEEEKKEITEISIDEVNHLMEKFDRNSLYGSFFDQVSIYKYMSEFALKFGTPLATFSSKSVMDKVEEFNKAQDEKISIMGRTEDGDKQIIEVKMIIDEKEKIGLEDLLKELDNRKEVEQEIIHSIGDWHVGGMDTDTIWISEAEQNPHPSQDELEKAGDDPVEVGRQMHEAIARAYNILRKDDETDEEFRRRVLNAFPGPRMIIGTPNRAVRYRPTGSVFLAHQNRRNLCSECVRTGCPNDLKERVKEDSFCSGYAPKVFKNLKCVICDEVLDDPESFPKGYPDKWRACCYCVEVWSIKNGIGINMVGMDKIEIEEKWKLYEEKMKEVFTL